LSRFRTQISQIFTDFRRFGQGFQDFEEIFSDLCASLRSLRLESSGSFLTVALLCALCG
jgi:hypothetical protein